MEDRTFKVCTLIRVKYGWKTKTGEDLNELSCYPVGRLIGEWNGLSPFRKIVLDHKQVLVILAGQRELQDINCNHLPRQANGNVGERCS